MVVLLGLGLFGDKVYEQFAEFQGGKAEGLLDVC